MLGRIKISAQHLENIVRVVPHSLKAPNVSQVITSRNKKVFHSVVYAFSKPSGKTYLKTN